MTQPGGMGIYIHWPYCAAKCPYCDFNSHVSAQIDHDHWRGAYLRAVNHYAALTKGRQVESVYFGGGTPSLMAPDTVEAVVNAIQKNWHITNDAEITLEANPTSVEAEKFKALKTAGVNRVSLGVQALNDNDLKFLGRRHSMQEALKAIDIAKENFRQYSFDLIYARPEQNLKNWRQELETALKYVDGHLSLYQLTIERGTPFYQDHAKRKFTMPGGDLAADFYNLTQDILEARGLPAYEVSNHARAGQESKHNLIYWHYGDYIGIGPGAHGRLTLEGQKKATREHRAPDIWLQRVKENGHGAHPFEALSVRERFMESLVMGLRLRGGIRLSALAANWRDYIDLNHVKEAQRQGWLAHDNDNLRLTREGTLRLSAILPYLLKG